MSIVWSVEDQAEGVLRQRRAFRDCVARLAGPPSGVDAAELIYGELVGNTVRYACGAVEARLELCEDHPPVLVVRDHGPGFRDARAEHRDPLAESGRGIGIVELLSDHVAFHDAEGGGTVVRATLPLVLRKTA